VSALVNGFPVDAWSDASATGWNRCERTIRAPVAACRGIATWLTFNFARKSSAAPSQAPSFALHSIEVRD